MGSDGWVCFAIGMHAHHLHLGCPLRHGAEVSLLTVLGVEMMRGGTQGEHRDRLLLQPMMPAHQASWGHMYTKCGLDANAEGLTGTAMQTYPALSPCATRQPHAKGKNGFVL